jgi:protocatechuate 3,4-dioxygenase alpha subunit
MPLEATAMQTVGPYFHIGLSWLESQSLAAAGVPGARVTIEGRVLDGDGKPVNDALIEVWQANAHGRYAHPEDRQDKPIESGFKGFARLATDEGGAFRLATIKPGRVPGRDGVLQAPHLVVVVFMRGLLKQLVTRMYFPDEPSNAQDPVLQLIDPERRSTLLAQHKKGRDDVLAWNILLQGEGETVFFEC